MGIVSVKTKESTDRVTRMNVDAAILKVDICSIV